MKEDCLETISSDEKFSVLMSVYYKESTKNFKNALQSILVYQNRKPDEFVLICDGPLTKGLDKVIDNYKQEFSDILKVYRLKENVGLGKALKAGLMKCKYNIIARADSDDICAPNRFQEQIGFINHHNDIAVVSSYIDEFYDDWSKPCRCKELPLTHEEIVKMAKFRNPMCHPAVMFRKDIILSVGSYRHVPYVEDYELWVRVIVAGYRLANIDQCLVHVRVGNGMVRRRGKKEQIDSWHKLNNYMLKHKMINHVEYLRNIIAVRGFVYMSSGIKELMYWLFLRRREAL